MSMSAHRLFSVLFLVLCASVAQAQIPITSAGTPYVQNFNTLASSGTSSVVPAGWAFVESGANLNSTYTAGTGSGTAGDTYSFGAAGSSDRAFGGLFSGSLNPTIGAQFVNLTGTAILTLNIDYFGEQWRYGQTGRVADRLDFQYSLNATSLISGTWTDVDALDFTSPINSGTTGAKNGNVDGRVAVSFAITGLNIPSGATFWIRWRDFDAAPGADDGLGIDDFSIVAGVPTGSTNPSGVGSANPDSLLPGASTLLSVTVTPGTNPPSSGLAVAADLGAIGGPSAQAFSNSGGNVFTFNATVAAGTTPGAKSIPVTIADGEGRSASTTIALTVQAPVVTADHLVISQVYGGGGNSGAQLRNDFVELYNPTTSPVSLNGWTLQYSGATANTWGASTDTVHLSGVVEPNRYYLIGLAQGNGGSVSLPSPHAWGTIAMSSSSGRVALVKNADPLSGDCPLDDPDVVDFVGYGSAVCGEGGTKAPALTNTTAALRRNNGATDTDNNQSDFTSGTPNPRNTTAFVDTFPTVMDIDPTQFDGQAPRDASISLMFSEDVQTTGTWFTIACVSSGLHDSATIGRSGRFRVITPNVNFTPGEQCTVTIAAAGVRDLTGNAMAADFTWKFTVAGAVALVYGPEVHLAMGNPSGAVHDSNFPANYLMTKPEFALSYNRDRGTPNWVSWHLAPEWDGSITRPIVDPFRPDPEVPADWYRVQHADYTNSGYSRGHMTASNDRTISVPANQATFLMTNILPQTAQNNSGAWLDFEQYLQGLTAAGQSSEAYVVAGGLGHAGFIGNGRVAVPTHTWKVVLILPLGTNDLSRVSAGARTIGIVIPNTTSPGSTNWMDWIVSVDQVEAQTGYDFFSNVSDAIENAIEAGLNGVNPPGAAGQNVSTDEDTARAIALEAAGSGPLTYSIVSGPAHGTLTGSGANVTYTPALNYYGNDSFTFKVSDGTRTSNTATVSIVVQPVNDAPVVTAISGPASAIAAGSTATILAGYSDPDPTDTHTATFAWDDGTSSTFSCGSGICTGSHTFPNAGIYTVAVTVTDNAGATASATFEHVIVFQESDAFLTGGGFIDTAAGRATFNINAKYQPNGNMTQFRAGGLDLKSKSYDWLVISGSKAQYRGTATVNGADGFTFLVTAYDGETDAFRITVWNPAGALVYDNVPGASTDLDVANPQPLGGGSIVVH